MTWPNLLILIYPVDCVLALVIAEFPPALEIFPKSGAKCNHWKKNSSDLGSCPRSGAILRSENIFISNNFFLTPKPGKKSIFLCSPMAYACSWIIIASLALIFPPKNWIKNLLLPQIWGIFPVLKIAIAPDLGKFSRSKCHLTDNAFQDSFLVRASVWHHAWSCPSVCLAAFLSVCLSGCSS